MTPLKQIDGTDCLRTCVASILDFDRPERVPNFIDTDFPYSVCINNMSSWLFRLGYNLYHVRWESKSLRVALTQSALFCVKDNHYVFCGGTDRFIDGEGINHAVVCQSGVIVHNPSDSRLISGMYPSTFTYDAFVIMPAH